MQFFGLQGVGREPLTLTEQKLTHITYLKPIGVHTMPNLDQPIQISITWRIVGGVILIIIGSYFRTQGIIGLSVWQNIRNQRNPSLQPGKSPADAVADGLEGCFFSILYGALAWVFFLLGLDQIFLGGRTIYQIYLLITVDLHLF